MMKEVMNSPEEERQRMRFWDRIAEATLAVSTTEDAARVADEMLELRDKRFGGVE